MNFSTAPIVALVLACGLLLLAAAPTRAQQVSLYSQANGWTTSQIRENGEVVACEAIRITGSEEGLFFRHDRQNTMIGFSSFASAASPFPIDVDMWFDNTPKAYQTYAMQPVRDHNGFDWRVLVLPNSEPWGELDLFANASSIHFGYDSGQGIRQVAFALTGTNRTAKDVYACVQNASQTQPPAPTTAGPQVIYGSCKLIVNGRTYVDMNAGCPIWLANDGTGTFWINTDRENYLGQYFAEVTPFGDGTASAHWNSEPGATHAQALLGEGFRMVGGGCWSNGSTAVCAAR